MASGKKRLPAPFISLFSFAYGGSNPVHSALLRDYDKRGNYPGIWYIFATLTFFSSIIMAVPPPVRDRNVTI